MNDKCLLNNEMITSTLDLKELEYDLKGKKLTKKTINFP